ncbi:hypothetical protein QJS66_22155 [Kocuria rhizophila]|nr:hypothetical protein QJS66_22155 [Kocuria rhizophila]
MYRCLPCGAGWREVAGTGWAVTAGHGVPAEAGVRGGAGAVPPRVRGPGDERRARAGRRRCPPCGRWRCWFNPVAPVLRPRTRSPEHAAPAQRDPVRRA